MTQTPNSDQSDTFRGVRVEAVGTTNGQVDAIGLDVAGEKVFIEREPGGFWYQDRTGFAESKVAAILADDGLGG